MAELKLVILASQCLDRRFPDKQSLCSEVDAWLDRRYKHNAEADRRFATKEARIKLENL